jgi:uncharacterized protein YkwD
MQRYIGWGIGCILLLACSGKDDDEDCRDQENPGGPVSTADEEVCAITSNWDSSWVGLEQGVLDAVNKRRTSGASCGGENFSCTHPLRMDPALQCASRLHSKDMAERDFFAHDNPSGENPWVRIEAAGFTGQATGENIAAGNASAEATVDQWMSSSGHCRNIMDPEYEFIGVGYQPGGDYGHLWTQTFGRSRSR